MKISLEKARMFAASWQWVQFTLVNTDIMTDLNHAPLKLKMVAKNKFQGDIFGVQIAMDIVVDSKPDPKDEVSIIADVQMPFGLGRTHTVAHYRYCSIDNITTMVDLQLSLDTVGPFMGLYAAIKKRHIDDYLGNVMGQNERAAILLQENDAALESLLSSSQLSRVASWRKELLQFSHLSSIADTTQGQQPILDGRAWHPEILELVSLYSSIQGKATHLEDELKRIRDTEDAVATLLVARRMLEVIITQVCEEKLKRPRGTEPLSGILDKIAHTQVMPEYIITSMQNLNRLSTYGAHPKNFSPRQVREALLALCSIVEWYVSTAAQLCQQHPVETA